MPKPTAMQDFKKSVRDVALVSVVVSPGLAVRHAHHDGTLTV